MADGSGFPPPASMEAMDHQVDKHVGDRVRTVRKALGWSQDRLATAIGVSFQQLQKYERASNRISASKLQAIARALGCSISDFFAGVAEREAMDVADPAGADRREERAQHAMNVRDSALMAPEIALVSGLRPAHRSAVRAVIRAFVAEADADAEAVA